ncbi:MAG: tetratricopeptide repeat protein [bacterium]
MTMRRSATILLLLLALAPLSACESAKDKAARHLQSALELVQKGDPDRAVVEFRNVFQLDPNNRDARMAYAALMQDRGNLPEAYAQYQRVIDLTPGDQEALRAAARLAAEIGRWPDAGKFADMELALSPGDPEMMAIRAGVDYATAFSAADTDGQAKAAATAQTLIAKLPDTLLLRRVVINNLMQTADYPAALAAIDAALVRFPKEKGLYQARVTVLAAQKDDAGVEAQLQKLVELFPDDPSMGAALLRWYITKNQIDQAEAFLRKTAQTGDLTARLNLVNFLRQFRSVDAALAEIDSILAVMPASSAPATAAPTSSAPTGSDQTATPDKTPDQTPDQTTAAPGITPEIVRALRASILFDQGQRDEAITAMQDIVKGAPASDQMRQIKVMLARMMFTVGNSVQARARVEEVLAEDDGQVEALKLKAAWLIDDDKTDDAVALLRKVLDASPRDAQAMTLLAQAYERAGNHDLTADMLSQAVIASGKAPAETMRYANFLMADAKYLPAESLLIDALRLDQSNVALLGSLGRLYVLMKDWPRATGVADRLDDIATPDATQASQSLRPAILAGTEKVDAAIDYLKGLAEGKDAGLDAKVMLIRAYLANGETDKARALSDDLLAKSPEDGTVRFIAATVQAALGDSAGAETVYRDLLKQDPKRGTVWLALARQLVQDGKPKDAEAAIDEALTALPDAGDLLLMKAGFLEQQQDPEAAITIYQKLYAADSSNQILANNLASMLSSYRHDPASLDQAYTIARRLRGTTNPAFADTYGWISQQRGNAQEALPYLETAAKGLPKDPMVQFHLAEVYKALNRAEDARAQYAKVLDLVPADDARDFVIVARKAAG